MSDSAVLHMHRNDTPILPGLQKSIYRNREKMSYNKRVWLIYFFRIHNPWTSFVRFRLRLRLRLNLNLDIKSYSSRSVLTGLVIAALYDWIIIAERATAAVIAPVMMNTPMPIFVR